MKFNRHDKGALITVMGALFFVVGFIIASDLQHDPSKTAQMWSDIMFYQMILGICGIIVGAGIVYSTPMLTHK